MLSRIIAPSGLYIADYALFFNLLVSSALLITYALLLVCNVIKSAINGSPFFRFKLSSLLSVNGYLLVSGLIVTVFYLVLSSWQSKECGFGYALVNPTKFCFAQEFNIFPISYLTLFLSQAILITLFLTVKKYNVQ